MLIDVVAHFNLIIFFNYPTVLLILCLDVCHSAGFTIMITDNVIVLFIGENAVMDW